MYKSNVNMNLYKTFYDVAQYGSISKAAAMNYTSQPAVSRSIKTLEEELNTKLFYRSKKGIELTPKGKELFYYVEQSCNSLITAERLLKESDELTIGKLAIGIPSHIATFYVLDAIDKFHQLYPNIEITIVSKSTTGLLEQLKSHEIDFIIDSEPINILDKNITIRHIKTLKNVLVASKIYDISDIKEIKDLENHPLILPVKGTANRKELEGFFFKNNIEPKNIINIHTSEVVISAIKRNLGIGYLLKDMIKEELKDGTFKEVSIDGLPKMGISLVYIEEYMTKVPKVFLKDFYNIEV